MQDASPKVLLTTVHRPLGIDNESCTKNITAEVFHTQVTRAQGIFSIGAIGTGWALEFIAANLNAPVTVLHYPTKKTFLRELRKGYDYVGIGFVICTFPKAIELCRLVRREAPRSKIVLGGYGTVLRECEIYADLVCREEGVNFMKKLLGEEEVDAFKIPRIKRRLSIMSVATRPEILIPVSLGCSKGCDFCCTSHFFKQKYIPFIKSGRELHEIMRSVTLDGITYGKIGIIDEDFLADKQKIMEMTELNAHEFEKPILFSCFATLKSLSQYTTLELLTMGLDGVFLGIESKRATYAKLRDTDATRVVCDLKNAGIQVLTSMIIGYDWHDENSVEEDFKYLLSLKPTLTQFMLYCPCPGTPLYNRLMRENRLLKVPYKYYDGFHTLFRHPYFSPNKLEELIEELFRREYEELGPSVCRVLEVQLNGYTALRDSANRLLRARARVHKNLCLEIYPLLRKAIDLAPSFKVREYLKDLKGKVEHEFKIPLKVRVKENAVPFLAFYTRLKHSLFPTPQPPTTTSRYRFN